MTSERTQRRGAFMACLRKAVRDFVICRVKKEAGLDNVWTHMSKHGIVARDIVAKYNAVVVDGEDILTMNFDDYGS